MDQLIYLYALGALLTGLMAGIAVSAPRALAVKVAAFGLAAAILPLSYASMASLLSKPKPIGFEWTPVEMEDASVLGAAIREGEGIYVLLDLPNAKEPRYYVLPWNREMAQQLQDAQREAQESGGGLAMRMPFDGMPFDDNIAEGERMFYPLPQPALPPKNYNPPPLEYSRPGQEA